jgi:hypothetical protein
LVRKVLQGNYPNSVELRKQDNHMNMQLLFS